MPDPAYVYVSEDGGLNWLASDSGPSLDCDHRMPQQLVDPNEPNRLYRFTADDAVERSEDGGQTWQRELNAVSLTEAEASYYAHSRQILAMIQREPRDALIQRATGNLIVAMGQGGVWVRTADAEWRPVGVGRYRREKFDGQKIISLVSGNLAFALAVPFLIVGTVFGLALEKMRDVYIWWGVPLWIIWGMAVFFSFPSLSFVFEDGQVSLLLLLPATPAIPWGIYAVLRLYRLSRDALSSLSLIAIGGGVFFGLPYLMWTSGQVPAYGTARAVSLLVVALTLFVSYRIVQPLLAQLPPADAPPVRKRRKSDQ